MTHPTTRPTESDLRLMAYLDGELTAAEQAEFERELAVSPTLQADLRTFGALSQFARENVDCLLSSSVADSIADDVMKALEATPLKKPSRKPARSRSVLIPVSFGLAMAAGFAIFFAMHTPATVAKSTPSTKPSEVAEISAQPLERGAPSGQELEKMNVYQDVQVEDLEVGDSATILTYKNADGKNSPVIWIVDRNEAKGL